MHAFNSRGFLQTDTVHVNVRESVLSWICISRRSTISRRIGGRERESQRLRGRAKDQGLVGGWIECYDVLHHVVATKTMRLVTVIVRSVRLRAVTNRVVPTLRFNPPRRFPTLLSLPSVAPSASCNETLVRSRVTFYPRYKLRKHCFSFFEPVPAKTMLHPRMLRIYDIHSVDFAHARFMPGINANKNLSKPKCSVSCIKAMLPF